jgi:aryl-alcohol dehydrogenase-like predicted oxidoreductase
MSERYVTRREFVRDTSVAVAGLAAAIPAAEATAAPKGKPLNYNENMEYRPLGRSGLMISAVCLGGHWKRMDKMVPGVFKGKGWLSAALDDAGFQKNRRDVVSRCIEVGINYIDACTREEILAYSEALRGRREQMHLGFSWYQEEMRNPNRRTTKALLETLDRGLQDARLDYVDLWRITMHEQSGKHTNEEVEQMMAALEKAKQQGKARFTGFSSHDRPHIKWMIETYPNTVDAIVTPYTAKSKELPEDSMFDAVRKHKVGVFGIKPFASGSLFKGDSALDSPDKEEDSRRARLAIRYILCNPAITAPIPGMVHTQQVDNVALAVQERRKLDVAEAKELEGAMEEAWAKLPDDYQWLKNWEYV